MKATKDYQSQRVRETAMISLMQRLHEHLTRKIKESKNQKDEKTTRMAIEVLDLEELIQHRKFVLSELERFESQGRILEKGGITKQDIDSIQAQANEILTKFYEKLSLEELQMIKKFVPLLSDSQQVVAINAYHNLSETLAVIRNKNRIY